MLRHTPLLITLSVLLAGCGFLSDLGFGAGEEMTEVASLPASTSSSGLETSLDASSSGSSSSEGEGSISEALDTDDPLPTSSSSFTSSTSGDETTGDETAGTSDTGETTGMYACEGPALDVKCPSPGLETASITIPTNFTVLQGQTDTLQFDVSSCVPTDRPHSGMAIELEMNACFWQFSLSILCPSGQEYVLVDPENVCGPCSQPIDATMLFRESGMPVCDCNLVNGTDCDVQPPLLGKDICDDFLVPCTYDGPWTLRVEAIGEAVTISSVALTFTLADG